MACPCKLKLGLCCCLFCSVARDAYMQTLLPRPQGPLPHRTVNIGWQQAPCPAGARYRSAPARPAAHVLMCSADRLIAPSTAAAAHLVPLTARCSLPCSFAHRPCRPTTQSRRTCRRWRPSAMPSRLWQQRAAAGGPGSRWPAVRRARSSNPSLRGAACSRDWPYLQLRRHRRHPLVRHSCRRLCRLLSDSLPRSDAWPSI